MPTMTGINVAVLQAGQSGMRPAETEDDQTETGPPVLFTSQSAQIFPVARFASSHGRAGVSGQLSKYA